MWAFSSVLNKPKTPSIASSLSEPTIVPIAALSNAKPHLQHQTVEIKKVPGGSDSLPEWKRRMIEKNEAAKKEVTDIMDDSLRRVMAKAEMKSEAQQGQAVESYISAVDWIMWSVNTVIKRVK